MTNQTSRGLEPRYRHACVETGGVRHPVGGYQCLLQILVLAAAMAVAVVGDASRARALTTEWTPFPDLVGMAEQIVDGRVTDIRESVNSRGMPVTLVTLTLADSLKGGVPSTYTVKLLGGKLGDMELRIPGMPEFKEGDHVVLFLAENGAAVCPLVGGSQGYFRVQPDPIGQEDVVAQHHSDSAVFGPSRRSGTATPWVDGKTTLEEFKNLIRAELRRFGAAEGNK